MVKWGFQVHSMSGGLICGKNYESEDEAIDKAEEAIEQYRNDVYQESGKYPDKDNYWYDIFDYDVVDEGGDVVY